MKLFTDADRKKRFMKTGLPVMFGIAWAPIIWILIIPILGPILFTLTGSWLVAQGAVLVVVLLLIFLLLKVFKGLGDKFYSNS